MLFNLIPLLIIRAGDKQPTSSQNRMSPPPFPTWHDDIREAQFPGDGHAPREEDHVLPPQLLDVSVEELQRHRQTWRRTDQRKSAATGLREDPPNEAGEPNAKNASEKEAGGWGGGVFLVLLQLHGNMRKRHAKGPASFSHSLTGNPRKTNIFTLHMAAQLEVWQ